MLMGLLSSSIRCAFEACFGHFIIKKLPKKWVLWIVLVAGVLMSVLGSWGIFDHTPKESNLIIVHGTVVSANTKTPEGGPLRFRLDSLPHELRYIDGAPHFGRVLSALRPGTKVIVWISYSGVLSRILGPEVWRIEKDGETLVSFDELVRAREANKGGACLIACLGVVSILVAFGGLMSERKREVVPLPDPQSP